jgi:hypothetical protein
MSKYLLYAFGEILLVVIGILIALQINNWNDERKNRQKEASILNQIHKDFLSNKVQLDSIKANNLAVLKGCDALLSQMPFKKDSIQTDSIRKSFSIIFSVKTFNPSNGAVEALINSSSFDLIQNDTLRNLLVSWKDVYQDYSEEEQYVRNLQIDHIAPFFRRNFSYMDRYSKKNLEVLISDEMQNLIIDKRRSIQEALDALRDEKVEFYVNEIIRHTKK